MIKAKHISVENIVLLLVFLFPVAGTFVRHWISDILGLLFLVSVYFYVKGTRTSLFPEEKKWLWGFVVYFAVFILTALVNGWSDEQTSWLGLEIRFLLIIPVYLMLREIKNIEWAFFYGLLTGLGAISIWGGYEIFVLKLERTWGTYSSLFIGPVTLLMSSLVVAQLLYSFKLKGKTDYRKILIFSIPVFTALLVVALSGARSAYLGIVAMIALYFIYYIRNLKVIIPLSLFIAGLSVVVLNIEFVQNRIVVAKQETLDYFNTNKKKSLDNISESSAGLRLEMWRGSWYLIKESPVFGVGRGNYNNAMQEYIDAGLVNPAVNEHSHPHNAFIETLVSRGIVGLLVMLFVLYYPFYIFYTSRKASPATSLMGMSHVILITIFSLTETAPFNKGNFVAINLIFLSLIFSLHFRAVNSKY